MPTSRNLFFDLLRIFSVALIVIYHVAATLNWDWFTQPFGIGGIADNFSQIGILILFIVSGAVLELTYGKRKYKYLDFVKKRFLRIYPAYWVSLLMAAVVGNVIAMYGWDSFYAFLDFTGFYAVYSGLTGSFLHHSLGYLNPVGWFIGTIVILYLLYPLISKFLDGYYWPGLLLIFLLTLIFRIYLMQTDNLMWYTFPLSRVADFAIGIFLVQQGWYFRKVTKSPLIKQLSVMSFYVFLVHVPVLYLLYVIPSSANFVVYFGVVAVLTIILSKIDLYIHQALKSRSLATSR